MITEPYVLVLNIMLHRHRGDYWADPLWKKDLEAHCVQIADLAIACPVKDGAPPESWEAITRTGITVHPLPAMNRFSWLTIPYLAMKLWRIVSSATIVHTGIAGWPFPLGWIAIPLARLRRRFIVVVVESAFWRIPPGVSAPPFARWRARISEIVNRWAIRSSDVSFFTTQSYRDTLHPGSSSPAYVMPAIWVDSDQLIPREAWADLGDAKGRSILFAGRLTDGKGVRLLLDAIVRSRIPVDIVGEGDLADAVLDAQRQNPTLVRLLAPVDYGTAFSHMLDGYAALVVPTISDEQPRIIFDAFARGVPVLASATTGNRQIVDHGRNGLLFEPNDAQALADALVAATRDPARLRDMGLIALQDMATQTHGAMHAVRGERIAAALAARCPPRTG